MHNKIGEEKAKENDFLFGIFSPIFIYTHDSIEIIEINSMKFPFLFRTIIHSKMSKLIFNTR